MTLRRFYPLGGTLAWPALVNPSWENDLTSWTPTYIGGTGTWRIRNDKATAGSKAAWWQGGAGSGSNGGIESLLENSATGVVVAGDGVTAQVDIGLDTPDQSKSNGELRIYWLDASLAVISFSAGNLIGGDSKGRWFTSSVTAFAPTGATSAKLRVWATANGRGGVLVDNARWAKL